MQPALVRIAEAQHGVFSRQQARAAGYTDRQIDTALTRGDWLKCASGVYRVAGTPMPFLAAAWVALHASGAGSMLSHRIAGQLHKLDGVPPPTVFDLYVPSGRRPRNVPRARIHRVDAGPPVRCLGMPVTPLPLTIIDLARELPADTGARIVADALRTHRVSLDALEREVARSALRPRITRARAAVRLADPRLESVLEAELFVIAQRVREALGRRYELVPQYEVVADGRFVARLDLAIPELCLGFEADGYATHALRPGFERDRERLALLQLADWASVAFTSTQIRRRPRWVFDVMSARIQQREREVGRRGDGNPPVVWENVT
jgi:hypothetical protein